MVSAGGNEVRAVPRVRRIRAKVWPNFFHLVGPHADTAAGAGRQEPPRIHLFTGVGRQSARQTPNHEAECPKREPTKWRRRTKGQRDIAGTDGVADHVAICNDDDNNDNDNDDEPEATKWRRRAKGQRDIAGTDDDDDNSAVFSDVCRLNDAALSQHECRFLHATSYLKNRNRSFERVCTRVMKTTITGRRHGHPLIFFLVDLLNHEWEAVLGCGAFLVWPVLS